jgi:hypothetical protein
MSVGATTLTFATMMVLAFGPLVGQAQNPEDAFLSDYSKLKAAPDNPFEELYLAPDARKRAPQYTAIMVDQPEVFIHPDSKYKGMKPDDMKIIADALREKVTAELKGGYPIVDKPGPNVLYVRLAVGDLMVQKKKRPILAYIPVGAVVYAAKNLASEVTSKVDVKNMKIEGEVLDSVTLEQLAVMTASRGALSTASAGKTTEPVSWTTLNDLFGLVGKRMRCRLDNAKLPESEWDKCGAIGLAKPDAKVKPE